MAQHSAEVVSFWTDIRTWQILAPMITAFIGFGAGTWLHYHYQRKLDGKRETDRTAALTSALLAEAEVILEKVSSNAKTLRLRADKPQSDAAFAVLVGGIRPIRPEIFQSVSKEIGILPRDTVKSLIRFYVPLSEYYEIMKVYPSIAGSEERKRTFVKAFIRVFDQADTDGQAAVKDLSEPP